MDCDVRTMPYQCEIPFSLRKHNVQCGIDGFSLGNRIGPMALSSCWKIYYSLLVLRSLLSPNDSLQKNNKKKNNIATVTIKQNCNNIGAEKNEKETDRETGKKLTSHSASSEQKEFAKQNKPAHIVRSKRTDRMRERGHAHTPRSVVPLLYFTLLYSIPIVMHFFLSYVFAVAHLRILEYFKIWFYFCLSFVNFLSRSRNDYSLMTLWVYSFVGFCFFHSIRSRNCTLAGQQRETKNEKKKTKHTH